MVTKRTSAFVYLGMLLHLGLNTSEALGASYLFFSSLSICSMRTSTITGHTEVGVVDNVKLSKSFQSKHNARGIFQREWGGIRNGSYDDE